MANFDRIPGDASPQTTPAPEPTTGADGIQVTPANPNHLEELGVVGLKRSGGVVIEEYLTQLQGERGRKVYQEMGSDPLIGGVLLAMSEIIGRLPWEFESPENATPEEQMQTQFAQECFEDMSDSWDVSLNQIMSMSQYGWAATELVYKRRQGPGDDPTTRSRFTDGRIGWRKFALRSQDTLTRWVFDDHGGLRGMIQQDQYGGGQRVIPIERMMLFRTDEYKGNPEGRSLLRSAYTPWWYKKRIQELEAIGIERDLAGMPVGYAPEAWFLNGGNDNLRAMQKMLKDARRNEVDGILLPMVYDEQNRLLVDFKLMSSGGARQFDTNAVISRYNNDVATSMLMDFITLGHEGVGSYALGAAKISMWQLVVESIAKGIASVVNQHAVPRLMRLNGWTPDRMPKLVYGDVAQADLAVLSEYLKSMIDAGVITPDDQLEAYIRSLAGLPSVNAAGHDAPLVTPGNTEYPSAPAEPAVGAEPAAAPAASAEPTVGQDAAAA